MLKRLFDSLVLNGQERREIKEYYNAYHTDCIAPLPRSLYDEFKASGKRLGFERLYFDRRRRLCGTFMMCAAYGDRYLPELCALITAVCGEHAWALPAHTAESPDARHEIDLFAAETALTLKEMAHLLGSRLPQPLAARIDAEINERILSVFERRRFGWETDESNWSAVCGGCVGMLYLYYSMPVPERVMDAMRAYLRGISPDGACMEGLGYYSYGFGYYVYFAALLKERTGTDISDRGRVRRLAEFQHAMYLGTAAASYSDSEPDTKPLMGLTYMLSELFGVCAPHAAPVRNDECGRWAPYIRSYLYKPAAPAAAYGETVYDTAQIYVSHKEHFSVFIKGGHNAEPHNHNDIGSFIISDNTRQLLCDPGCGEYTADYFKDETRYGYLCCSSLGHSVPIIDGTAQMHGREYRCTGFDAGNDRVRLELGGAYPIAVRITRELELQNRGVTLRDSFLFPDGQPHCVIERLVTDIMPRIEGGVTCINDLVIDRAARVTAEVIKDHGGNDRTVYLLDFTADLPIFEIHIDIKPDAVV